MSKTNFFSDNSGRINALIESVNAAHERMADNVLRFRLRTISLILSEMLTKPAEWSEKCRFNIELIGEQFIRSSLMNGVFSEDANINDIYHLAFRFLCEYDFFGGTLHQTEIEIIITDVLADANEAENQVLKRKLSYSAYYMPARIARNMLSDDRIKSIKAFEETVTLAEKKNEGWMLELSEKEEKVNLLKNALENYKEGFNFVGLRDGFSNLNKKKKMESWISLSMLFVIAAIILIPLWSTIGYIQATVASQDITLRHFFIFLPVASIEVILIYIFRVTLLEYKSVKTQIIQLELRMALCQFIQNYAEYAKIMKKEDKGALEKFENIIFSSILSDPHEIPGTFDGMEQISAIIQNLKK